MERFRYDSVLDLNTKNLDNSLIFVSVPHMALFAKRFGCYGISKIDSAAEFCSRQNSSWMELNFWASGWPKLQKS
jgi:hypothetical protein